MVPEVTRREDLKPGHLSQSIQGAEYAIARATRIKIARTTNFSMEKQVFKSSNVLVQKFEKSFNSANQLPGIGI
jgi:hypothetical protein